MDEVLQPEWRRLRIAPVGGRGFCEKELPADAPCSPPVEQASGLSPPGVAPGKGAEGTQTDGAPPSAGIHPTVPFGATPNGTGATPVPPLVIYVNLELEELRRLHESLPLEIIAVIVSPGQLKESAESQREAEKLAVEIKELSGAGTSRIC